MLVYTISKHDLYQSGIEPARKVLNGPGENDTVDYPHIMAKILMELQNQTGNIIEGRNNI